MYEMVTVASTIKSMTSLDTKNHFVVGSAQVGFRVFY